jgi:putative ABC transport system substrate-binding protein
VKRRDFVALLGVAVAWPVGARAQQPMPVIGYLSVRSPETDDYRLAGFRQGLNETGYVEARDVAIEYRYAQGHQERMADLAVDLVRHHVSVIAASPVPLRHSPPKRRARQFRSCLTWAQTRFSTASSPASTDRAAT